MTDPTTRRSRIVFAFAVLVAVGALVAVLLWRRQIVQWQPVVLREVMGTDGRLIAVTQLGERRAAETGQKDSAKMTPRSRAPNRPSDSIFFCVFFWKF